MKELQKQLKEKKYHKVYLLMGDEEYLLLQARELLKRALVNEGDRMNYRLFEDNKVDLAELRELALTFPFFSDKRVLMLNRTDVIKEGKDDLIVIFEELPDTTCMIICEPEVDKRSKVYKWIKKNGYVAEFSKKSQNEKSLLEFVAFYLKKYQKKITKNDALYFLQLVGDDMFTLKNEMDKLISYKGEEDIIQKEDIMMVTSGQVQNKIFELVSAISKKDKQTALSRYNDLILLKEPSMRILYLIVRQYRILIIVQSMKREGKPDSEIAKAAGIPTFSIRNYMASIGKYRANQLEQCLESCIHLEESIKTGRITDQLGLEALIVELSS